MNVDEALIRLGESTSEAVAGIMQMFAGDAAQPGPVAIVPAGSDPLQTLPKPAVTASVSYVDGERIGVFSHGDVEFLGPHHPEFAEIEEHLTNHYGSSPSSWGNDIVYCRLQPSWMVGYAFDKAGVLKD